MSIHNQIIDDGKKNLSPRGLVVLGAYFPIEVHTPLQIAEVLTKQGAAVPTPVSGVGLIDTGATYTCIEETILSSNLQVNPIGVVNVGTADGQRQRNVYRGRVVFPTKGWTMDLARVVGVDLSGQFVRESSPKPIVALLGRNFLERCIFIYNGAMGSWTVAM